MKNLLPSYSPWLQRFFSLIYYHHKIQISLHYTFFYLFHLRALNVTSGIATTLLHPCSFSLAEKLSIFRTKHHVSRRGFLQSSLRRSNIYDVRFLFRILARRRAVPTESLYVYSKPSLSLFQSLCLLSSLLLARSYFLSLRFLLDARGQSRYVPYEKNRRSRETRGRINLVV